MFPDTSAAACQAALEPYHEQLKAIATKGIAKFNEMPADYRLPFMRFKKGLATGMWVFVMDELMRTYPEGDKNCTTYPHFKKRYDSIEIHFGANLVARIKKMNDAGFTSNYPTKRNNAYHTDDQAELFVVMWAAPLRVDVGYVLNEFATVAERVMVARRKTPSVIDWTYNITEPDTGAPVPLHKSPVPTTPETLVAARGSEESAKDANAKNA